MYKAIVFSLIILTYGASGLYSRADEGKPVIVPQYVFYRVLPPGIPAFWCLNKKLYGGCIDPNGTFLPSGKKPIDPTDPTPPPAVYSGPLQIAVNLPKAGNSEHVYEYRSGLLIAGELAVDGSFVPKEGSKIINIKDFKYTPDAPRIYNLPGRFRKAQ